MKKRIAYHTEFIRHSCIQRKKYNHKGFLCFVFLYIYYRYNRTLKSSCIVSAFNNETKTKKILTKYLI